MAEVKRMSAKMQLEADGAVLRATYEYEMATASKAVFSFSGEIGGVTDAVPGNAAPTAYVREESWMDYVNLCRPRPSPKLPRKQAAAEPTAEAMVVTRTETVPDTVIHFLSNTHPFMRMPPVTDAACRVFEKYGPPDVLRLLLKIPAERNCCVDLHEDILRQHANKGFAEVGVHFTADGVKNFFVLPPQQ